MMSTKKGLILMTILLSVSCRNVDDVPSDGGLDDEVGDDAEGVRDTEYEPLPVVEDEVNLAITSAWEESTVGHFSVAETTDMYAVVGISITNGLDNSISVAPILFRLRTNEGLEQLAHQGASTEVDQPCPGDALLAPGSSISCHVVFELTRTTTPTDVVYTWPELGLAQVTVDIEQFHRCDRCDGECTDLDNDAANCGQCRRQVPQWGRCDSGELQCTASRTVCGWECVDSLESPDHCGGCNMACPQSALCEIREEDGAYICTGSVRTPYRRSCDDVCTRNDALCDGGETFHVVTSMYDYAEPCSGTGGYDLEGCDVVPDEVDPYDDSADFRCITCDCWAYPTEG